jgi:hypothetical protein
MYLPIPLRTHGNDGAPNLPAVRHARGGPVDRFSFRETRDGQRS